MSVWARSKAIIPSFLCLLMFLFMLALASKTAAAEKANAGTWSAELRPGSTEFHLSMNFGRNNEHINHTDFVANQSEFSHLNFAWGETNPHSHFEIVREAGTFFFDGVMSETAGAGKFTFTPNAKYVDAMRALGYTVKPGELVNCALFDLSTAYVKQMRAAGYNPTFDQLQEMRIFRVDADHIATITKLEGKKPSIDDLVQAKIFKVTPEFAAEAKSFGFGDLSMEDLTALRIHGVDRDFLDGMKQAGYSGFSADKAVEMRIHGVSPQFVRELASLGYQGLSIDQLVEMRIFGVDPPYIKRQLAKGKRPTVDQLVERKQFGEHADHDRDDMI